MSDKVWRVSIERDQHEDAGMWYATPDGSHMLVPVEAWERIYGALRLSEKREDFLASKASRRALAEIGASDE
jgi:hypothetical protein